MITMKLWTTTANELIELNYNELDRDDLGVAQAMWLFVARTGRYPGTGQGLSRAYYWSAGRMPGEGPDRTWSARAS